MRDERELIFSCFLLHIHMKLTIILSIFHINSILHYLFCSITHTYALLEAFQVWKMQRRSRMCVDVCMQNDFEHKGNI